MRVIDCFFRRASKFVMIGMVALHYAASSDAQDPASAFIPKDVTRVRTVEGITEYRLSNGMKVLLAPDASDDKVTVNITYMVGSRHEGQGEGGMAHLLEHLVFKGTPKTPDPKQEFRKRGFTFNGTTTSDRTNYFATFTSSQEALDWYIGWQADAMVNSYIAKKDLDSEMTVVRNEFEIAGNNPFQLLGQKLAHAAYETHAYGKPTVGNREDIENVDIEKLQAFYKRYYRPDNAVLIVAGKFEVAKTLAAMQLSLGQLKKPESTVPAVHAREAPQDGERTVIVRRPAPTQVIIANFHAPGAMHPDSPALNVLATALGDVPAGRLHKALVESKLTLGVFAASVPRREAGTISFVTGLAPTEDGAKSQKILIDTVEGVGSEAIRHDEFERAKTKILKSLELA
ncbi:MAG: M16 family metallopeptidase, partial [Burkholderiales bacterium]